MEYDTNNKIATKDMSKVASTTGNIYGVYDMSGGGTEYVMGVYTDGTDNWSGYSSTDNSGFNGCLGYECDYGFKTDGLEYPESKYYNSYTTFANYTNANLQHALKETANWYNDYDYFVSQTFPWYTRGRTYKDGTAAGVFAYYYSFGSSNSLYSSRAVLVK